MIEHMKCPTLDFAKGKAKKQLALFPECEGEKGIIVRHRRQCVTVRVHVAGQAGGNAARQRNN